jgi:hypothetical protein
MHIMHESDLEEDLAMAKKPKKPKPMSASHYRDAIEKLGLTQEGAGDVIGLSPRQAQRVVAGHSPVPRPVAKLITLILKRKITVEEATEAG